jgi:Divergent InlB B-repeat domain
VDGAHAPAAPALLGAHGLAVSRSSSLKPHPLGSTDRVNVSALGVSNTSNFSWIGPSNWACDLGNFCFNDSADPSFVSLQNGNIGLAFSSSTNESASTCPWAGPARSGTLYNVTWQVGFSVSSNGGQSFGAPHLIENQTCPYLDALEPSFASAGGTVYGAFLEANFSVFDATWCGAFPLQCNFQSNLSEDAIGFVAITNNGTTFSPVRTITATLNGSVDRPQLAVVGDTLYLVYSQLNNSTTLPDLSWYGGRSYPETLEFMRSVDGGQTWSAPQALPASNLTNLNTSLGASIAVGPGGVVGVSYATNFSCAAFCTAGAWYTGPTIGSDILLATSSTNGTTWSTSTISPFAAQRSFIGSAYYSDEVPVPLAEPQTSLVWAASGEPVVGWTAGYNGSSYRGTGCASYPDGYCYVPSGAWIAVSTNSGVSWTISNLTSSTDPEGYTSDGDSNIAVEATSASTIEASLTYYNASASRYGGYVYCGIGASRYGGREPSTGSPYTEYLETSTNGGGSWGASILGNSSGSGSETYIGTSSAITTGFGGRPLAAFDLPAGSTYRANTALWQVGLQAAMTGSYLGSTANLTVNVSGLPPGTNYTLTLSGATVVSAPVLTSASTVVFVGVPVGALLELHSGTVSPNDWEEYVANTSGALFAVPAQGSAITIGFSAFVEVTVSSQIANFNQLGISGPELIASSALTASPTWYYDWTLGYRDSGCPFPWYLPAGNYTFVANSSYSFIPSPTQVQLYAGDYEGGIDPGYWLGSGPGNYTGAGPGGTFDLGAGAITEEAGFGGWGTNFTSSFDAVGLPSTSTFSFDFNGTSYSEPATASAVIGGLESGFYPVADIRASAPSPGWEYFGQPIGGPDVDIPLQSQVTLNFSTLENLSASPGVVTFHAIGVANGTPWTLSINGTTYSAESPWLNGSLRPGTYPIAGGPAVAVNDSVAYLPEFAAPTLSVTPLTTYPIDFEYTYSVSAYATMGGLVEGAGQHWVAPGGSASFAATAIDGYSFAGWQGDGLGSYTGTNRYANVTVSSGPIMESAIFQPPALDRYYLNFTETGVPAGTYWTVVVNGSGYSSDTNTLSLPDVYSCSVSGAMGDYALSVPAAYASTNGTRYLPESYSPTLCGGSPTALQFQPQNYVVWTSTPGGSIDERVNGTVEPNAFWLNAGASVSFTSDANAGYLFIGWNGTGLGSYTGPLPGGYLKPLGPVTEAANFQPLTPIPPVRYAIDLHAPGVIAPGTSWSVVLNGTALASTGAWINATGFTTGTYPLVVNTAVSGDGLTEYLPVDAPTSVPVKSANASLTLTYLTKFWVSIGLVGSGLVGPADGFYTAGLKLSLNASASPGVSFGGWRGNGTGSYTGPDPNGTATVSAPITEIASFTANASAPVSSTSTNFFQSGAAWALFGSVGLVVGVGIGVALFRRGKGPTTGERPPEPAGSTGKGDP